MMSEAHDAEKLTFKLNLRLVSLLLLITTIIFGIIILGMLFIWRPWDQTSSDDRTVKVTGESKILAEPDEYVFYPSYQFKNADKTAGLDDMTKKSEEIVAKLKDLGVEDSKIKTNSSGYDTSIYMPEDGGMPTYTLQLTVKVGNKDLAQKVQDYLLSTAPSGSVTPQPGFSDAKRKELEAKARDEATKDARSKADQSAQNLGFKVSKVKTVEDGAGFGDVYPVYSTMEATAGLATDRKMTIQAGENEINYSVTVTYFVR